MATYVIKLTDAQASCISTWSMCTQNGHYYMGLGSMVFGEDEWIFVGPNEYIHQDHIDLTSGSQMQMHSPSSVPVDIYNDMKDMYNRERERADALTMESIRQAPPMLTQEDASKYYVDSQSVDDSSNYGELFHQTITEKSILTVFKKENKDGRNHKDYRHRKPNTETTSREGVERGKVIGDEGRFKREANQAG